MGRNKKGNLPTEEESSNSSHSKPASEFASEHREKPNQSVASKLPSTKPTFDASKSVGSTSLNGQDIQELKRRSQLYRIEKRLDSETTSRGDRMISQPSQNDVEEAKCTASGYISQLLRKSKEKASIKKGDDLASPLKMTLNPEEATTEKKRVVIQERQPNFDEREESSSGSDTPRQFGGSDMAKAEPKFSEHSSEQQDQIGELPNFAPPSPKSPKFEQEEETPAPQSHQPPSTNPYVSKPVSNQNSKAWSAPGFIAKHAQQAQEAEQAEKPPPLNLLAMSLARVRTQAKQYEANRKFDPSKFRHVKSKVKRNLKVQDQTHFSKLKTHHQSQYSQSSSPMVSTLRADQQEKKSSKPKKKKVVSKVKQNLQSASKAKSRASSPPAKSEASKARSMRPATTTQAQKRRPLLPSDKKKSRNSPGYMSPTESQLNKVTKQFQSRMTSSQYTSVYSSQSPSSSRQRPRSGQKLKNKSAFHKKAKKTKKSGPPSIPDVNPGKEDTNIHIDVYEYEPDESMKREAEKLKQMKSKSKTPTAATKPPTLFGSKNSVQGIQGAESPLNLVIAPHQFRSKSSQKQRQEGAKKNDEMVKQMAAEIVKAEKEEALNGMREAIQNQFQVMLKEMQAKKK